MVLAKPRTFMNNSGEAVEYLLSRFGSRPSSLLVIYDEMAILPGRIRLRASGSDAGHNGIRSIIQTVGGTGFPRLRIGIGAPPPGLVARDYVLGKFEDDESESILGAVDRAAAAVLCVLEEGIDVAMNRFNQDPPLETGRPASGIIVPRLARSPRLPPEKGTARSAGHPNRLPPGPRPPPRRPLFRRCVHSTQVQAGGWVPRRRLTS